MPGVVWAVTGGAHPALTTSVRYRKCNAGRNHVKKGSKEAKRLMARLRAMRKLKKAFR